MYRLKFPFQVDCYTVDYGHSTPSLLEPDLFAAEPLLSMLRMQYLYHLESGVIASGENRDGVDPKLQVPAGELASLRCLNLRECLASSLELLMSASSHRRVTETLEQVSVMVHTTCCLGGKGSGISFPQNVGSLWMSVAGR